MIGKWRIVHAGGYMPKKAKRERKCTACNGSGKSCVPFNDNAYKCAECGGTGKANAKA